MSAGKLLATAAGLIGVLVINEQAERRRFFRLQFDKFHETIKHDEGDERQMLRQKRELLCQELRERLPADLKPTFFDQGSYAMQTGIVPIDGDFDIDVGLVFECGSARFDSPVQAKTIIRDTLAIGARKVRIRRSCVTVQYSKQGDLHHHVDIAVYARAKDGGLLLAKGKEHSKQQLVFWEPSHPQRLLKLIRERYEGQRQSQFRRCIRYLK